MYLVRNLFTCCFKLKKQKAHLRSTSSYIKPYTESNESIVAEYVKLQTNVTSKGSDNATKL
eukprot:snap_masked-scaffold_2-processed-gene-5.4-mRNA-1 protein AED:1.00 eAED:1.00 QI:0/-1/0/0/-1/1/1/0/60